MGDSVVKNLVAKLGHRRSIKKTTDQSIEALKRSFYDMYDPLLDHRSVDHSEKNLTFFYRASSNTYTQTCDCTERHPYDYVCDKATTITGSEDQSNN